MKKNNNNKKINLQSTIVFQKNWEALNGPKRFICNSGGSRSSKTVSICQCIILYAMSNQNKQISIVRKTLPALKATAMKDFFEELHKLGFYNVKNHHKSDCTYTFPTNTVVTFFSCDDQQKLRGRKSHIVWLNESNEVFYDELTQLNLRTEEKLIFDYNPSEQSSWLYELPVDETVLIESTYLDNPFLSENQIKQIESYRDTDEELWQVFGLGKRITPRQNIYSNWNFIDEKPDRFQSYVMGIDYGFNHPSALVKTWFYENELYLEEVFYERYLTANDIVGKFETLDVSKSTQVIAEIARPEINEELIKAGFYILNANKAVKEGIDAVKSFKVHVSNSAKNIKKEYENYKWKKNGERILDEPIKNWDDALDAVRYAALYIRKTHNFIDDGDSPEFFSLEY